MIKGKEFMPGKFKSTESYDSTLKGILERSQRMNEKIQSRVREQTQIWNEFGNRLAGHLSRIQNDFFWLAKNPEDPIGAGGYKGWTSAEIVDYYFVLYGTYDLPKKQQIVGEKTMLDLTLHENKKRGKMEGYEDLREIMEENLSEEKIKQIIKIIDEKTQDDASTYELSALLIERDKLKKDDPRRKELAKIIKTKINSILTR